MSIDQAKHGKLKKLFRQVLINYEAQEEWEKNVDPDFLKSVETMINSYDKALPKEQWFRTGVMMGAVYEQWRQHNESAADPGGSK